MKFNTQKEYSTHVNDDVSSIFDPGYQTLFSRFKYFGGGGVQDPLKILSSCIIHPNWNIGRFMEWINFYLYRGLYSSIYNFM